MPRIALLVTAEFPPELREEILQGLLAHRERCLRTEPGTLQFDVLAPIEEPGCLKLVEVYADAEAFTAHQEGSSMTHYRADTRSKITRVSADKCLFGQELGA